MQKQILVLLSLTCGLMLIGCDASSRDGFERVALPHVVEEPSHFRIVLDRVADGIQATVLCREQGDVTELALVSTHQNATRSLKLQQAFVCDSTDKQLLQGIVFTNQELASGQNLDLALSAQVYGKGAMVMYATGYTFRADNRGVFYVEK